MERLRYVARAEGTPQRVLVSETADALLDVVGDHAGLVTACRQMVQRQPTAAALVWLAAHLLQADDPDEVMWDLVRDLDEDPTDKELAHQLAESARVVTIGWPEVVTPALGRRGDVSVCVLDGPVVTRRLPDLDAEPLEASLAGAGAALAAADVLVIEALGTGPDAFLAPAGTLPAAAAAHHLGVPVWLVVPRGRSLPKPLWAGLVRRLPEPTPAAAHEIVGGELVSVAIGPTGQSTLSDIVGAGGCPVAPELQ